MIEAVANRENTDGTNLLWLNWSGGGNLPPSLGIARVLVRARA